MMQLQERPVEKSEEARPRVERCAGCGRRDTPNDPLPWEIPSRWGDSDDLYCEACYLSFRTHYEEAEEAVLAALRHFKLHEVYTPEHLFEALASLGTSTPEAFEKYLETGKTSELRPRTFKEEAQDN